MAPQTYYSDIVGFAEDQSVDHFGISHVSIILRRPIYYFKMAAPIREHVESRNGRSVLVVFLGSYIFKENVLSYPGNNVVTQSLIISLQRPKRCRYFEKTD